MSLFTAPIREITYDDVVSFCEQGIHEGISLDYKADFNPDNKKLARSICAFANTNGGSILIGVQDDGDNKPKPPFEGINHKKGFEDKVTSIILENIYPPVIETEIGVCKPVQGKTFVIIRIPQSDHTPHAIYNQTEAYIRTGSRNKKEDLATMEQLEWLRDRRKISIELRERILKQAEDRYELVYDERVKDIQYGMRTFSFIPLYPQKPLFDVARTQAILLSSKVAAKYADFPTFSGDLEQIQNGMFRLDDKNIEVSYTEANHFGLFFGKDVMYGPAEDALKPIHLGWFLLKLDVALEAAGKFYAEIGYSGLILCAISLERIIGIRLEVDGKASKPNDAQESLSWPFTIAAPRLTDSDTRQAKLLELAQEVGWSFGLSSGGKKMKDLLEKCGRWS